MLKEILRSLTLAVCLTLALGVTNASAKKGKVLTLSDGTEVVFKQFKVQKDAESGETNLELRFFANHSLELSASIKEKFKSGEVIFSERSVELCNSYGLRLAQVFKKHYSEYNLKDLLILIYYPTETTLEKTVFLISGVRSSYQSPECSSYEKFAAWSTLNRDGSGVRLVRDKSGNTKVITDETIL